MALNDPRASAVGTRGLAARGALDEELHGMSLPGVQFGQPPQDATPAEPTQSLEVAEQPRPQWQIQEETVAQEAEDSRSTTEGWLRVGGKVVGAIGGALVGGLTTGGPGAIPGAIAGSAIVGGAVDAGVGVGRASNPGAVAELRQKRGEDISGQRALQGAQGAVAGLETGARVVGTVEGYAARADEAAVLEASNAAFNLETDEGFAEGEFLMSDSGGKAYLNTERGDGTYGRDRQYMEKLDQYKRLRFPGIGKAG